MANKFSQKLLSFSFNYASGNFSGGGNAATITTSPPQGEHQGLRASCRIEIQGGNRTSSLLDAAIYGLPQTLMNQLTILPGILNAIGDNTITVMAGDVDGMSLVFFGTVFAASMDGTAQPHVPLRIHATPDSLHRMKPIEPTSVSGSADVAQIMGQLAGKMGLSFENNGVTAKVSNPYLPGPPRIQVEQLARHAGIQALVDKGKLAIWNPGQGRSGASAIISPETGMIGYPAFDNAQIVVKTIFDPTIDYGQKVQVKSSIPIANGTWVIKKELLELESFMPKGKWFATLWGTPTTVKTQVAN